jgi:uncharacterized membrane protein YphA (DoxX/SURF4 family)
MTRVLRAAAAVLTWLFVLAIPIQFYLAGHGAMEGAHAADKSLPPMSTAWDPHAALGTFMGLATILILLLVLAGRFPRPFLIHAALLFVFMLIQFFLPAANDSASTRWIAALHGVNALVITGLGVRLGILLLPYLPFRVGPRGATEQPTTAGSEPA